MTDEEHALNMIRASISNLPPGFAKMVYAAASDLRSYIAEKGDAAHIALALVGAEVAASENG